MAVSSSSPAVAARCAFARAGVGAASSQNITDPSLGERCLDLMAHGASAQEALEEIVRTSDHVQFRQLTAVDVNGGSACFSGEKTLGINATFHSFNVACAGNLLSGTKIPEVMANAFAQSAGHLADRLLLSMNAAVDAGGEEGPIRSAGMLIVNKISWPVVNLRVDWHEEADPIGELVKIWKIYEPQLQDYVTRALDPSDAPSYGVPGNDNKTRQTKR